VAVASEPLTLFAAIIAMANTASRSPVDLEEALLAEQDRCDANRNKRRQDH